MVSHQQEKAFQNMLNKEFREAIHELTVIVQIIRRDHQMLLDALGVEKVNSTSYQKKEETK